MTPSATSHSWIHASAVSRTGEGRFSARVPEGWQQGRGTFGGLVLAIAARAVEAEHDKPDWRLRTLTAELCGPIAPGALEILVEPLRLGSGTSTVAARLVQGGELAAHVVIVLGRRREGPSVVGVARPEMPPHDRVAPMPPNSLVPQFTQHLEYRPTGPLPFSGAARGESAGWIRFLDPGEPRDAAWAIGMADAWWPAMFSLLTTPRPTATITFTLDLVGDPTGVERCFHQAHTLSVSDGYQPELRTIWAEDGRLLAVNHQTFVIIK